MEEEVVYFKIRFKYLKLILTIFKNKNIFKNFKITVKVK